MRKFKYQIIAGSLACVLVGSILIAIPVLLAATDIVVGAFSTGDVEGWKSKRFSGETAYTLKGSDNAGYLQAHAQHSASAYYRKYTVDLMATPYLNWRWRLQQGLEALDEQVKSGDDYAARVYVIYRQGIMPWQTVALNYVWSSRDIGVESWPNAYTGKAVMIALRSSRDQHGVWQQEKVNVREDFKKYFNLQVEHIQGVAIMTDTDDSQRLAIADYGDLFFSAR